MKATAVDIVSVLGESTPFAENIVRRQCERLGFAFPEIPATALPQVIQNVLAVMRQYAEPTAYVLIEKQLRSLLQRT